MRVLSSVGLWPKLGQSPTELRTLIHGILLVHLQFMRFEYLMTVLVKVARPSCGTQFLSRLLSSEVSTSFKERIDVFIAHYRWKSVCFLLLDLISSIVFVEFDIGIHLAWDHGRKH